MPDAMRAPLLSPPARVSPWPRQWSDQQSLLERQHDRLEHQLLALISLHRPEAPAWEGGELLSCDLACRRLLWALRLHLRLEERWLDRRGCLCQAHRAAHRDAAQWALEGYGVSSGDRAARLAWLEEIKAWFFAHRDGIDARAYRLAHLACQP
jgi:hemerythrin